MDLAEARATGLPIAIGATDGSNDEREENVTPGPGEASQKAGDVRPARVRPPAVVEEPEELGWQPPAPTSTLRPEDYANGPGGQDPTDALVARIDRIIAKARTRDADRISAKLDELEAALS